MNILKVLRQQKSLVVKPEFIRLVLVKSTVFVVEFWQCHFYVRSYRVYLVRLTIGQELSHRLKAKVLELKLEVVPVFKS